MGRLETESITFGEIEKRVFRQADKIKPTLFPCADSYSSGKGKVLADAFVDPCLEFLPGSLAETRNVIQKPMVELVEDRFDSRFDLTEIHQPAQAGIDITTLKDMDFEMMAMDRLALAGVMVCGFKIE